jgi:hypothetical protein
MPDWRRRDRPADAGTSVAAQRRHALYERNDFGNHENIRTEVVFAA